MFASTRALQRVPGLIGLIGQVGLLGFFTAGVVAAQTAPVAPTLPSTCAQIEVHNVRPGQGQLMVAAYGSEADFNKKPLAMLRVSAGAEPIARLVLCGLEGLVDRQLAIQLFQDLDGDGQMARNPFGIPTEPWGSSGRPRNLGPNWESARVVLGAEPVVVRLSP